MTNDSLVIPHQHEPPSLVYETQHDEEEQLEQVIDELLLSSDCTISYMRILTAPPIDPPSLIELKQELLRPWNVCLPIDTSDTITCHYWSTQERTNLFGEMFEWNDDIIRTTTSRGGAVVKLQPYFNLSASNRSSSSTSTTFTLTPPIWKEVALCMQQLLFRRVGCRHSGTYASLTCFGQCIFLATGPGYIEEEIWSLHVNPVYYFLRCHCDSATQELIFGYHHCTTTSSSPPGEKKDPRKTFFRLVTIPLRINVDWRLKTCQILTNMARILNSLIDFGIPLTCQPQKRSIHGDSIQKMYTSDTIGGIPGATVKNMLEMYRTLRTHAVPHTDQLLGVEGRTKRCKDEDTSNKTCITICRFGPIGRSYPPMNIHELLDALVCVAEALVALHRLGWMHRDIRWANVFHAFLQNDDNTRHQKRAFSNEWVLFDFEFAAKGPQQPSFDKYTLTTSNHAPEMFTTKAEFHTTAVDIWALGYLIQTANVDIPKSHHAMDLEGLRKICMNDDDPNARPNAIQCLEILRALRTEQAYEISKEKTTTLLH